MKKQHDLLVSSISRHVDKIRGDLVSLGGLPISQTNVTIIVRMVESWLFLTEDLMLRQCLSDEARRSRMDNFVHALTACDFVETLSFLDACFMYLVREHEPSIETFKQFLFDVAPTVDYRGLLSPINQLIYPFLIELDREKKAHFLASIVQFLRFPRKLELQDIGLEEQAILEYLETEQELAAVSYDDEELLDGISNIIKDWFGGFYIDNLRPQHGSGSVAEGPLSLAEKFVQCKIDKQLEILLANCSDPSSYNGYFPVQPGTGLVRCSRTIFVPKTATKLRTISMEPIALQYIQQGVMYELYKYIDRHPYLGCRVRLGDQTQNQLLAWEGSKYQTYGTIDLSHASDSVSWALIKRVFRSVPLLYKWLLGTRSNRTLLPDGTTMSLCKFAPMGSALCFPIQCILFAAIVEHASRKRCKHHKEPMALYSVYGDDLVVPSTCYDQVCQDLVALGFSVNDKKSFNTGNFRESCGKDYYAGSDISVLYYRTPYYNKRVSPSAFGSWCSSANNAFLHRLPIYRLSLINKLNSVKRCRGPYFVNRYDMSPYIGSPQATNFHSKVRWSCRYQRYEGRFIVVQSRQRDAEFDDDALAYFVKLVEMSKRSALTRRDEQSSSVALQGCVEFFSSTTLPITAYVPILETYVYR